MLIAQVVAGIELLCLWFHIEKASFCLPWTGPVKALPLISCFACIIWAGNTTYNVGNASPEVSLLIFDQFASLHREPPTLLLCRVVVGTLTESTQGGKIGFGSQFLSTMAEQLSLR